MGKMNEPILAELRDEAAITRRVLERVPANKLAWRPHAKSMSLGELAMHLAGVPGGASKLAQVDQFDAGQANFNPPSPKSVEEILAVHDQSVRDAEACLSGLSDQALAASWRLTVNGKEIFSKPRTFVVRTVMLNHWYHHRGQLSVYLRLLDVPVPVIYGRSADENPFA
jgi:uncharacterized damage-inducible protein DinB